MSDRDCTHLTMKSQGNLKRAIGGSCRAIKQARYVHRYPKDQGTQKFILNSKAHPF
jgi:hypothetical protein